MFYVKLIDLATIYRGELLQMLHPIDIDCLTRLL